jgi:transcriptional regulator with XRE-family HTH domain
MTQEDLAEQAGTHRTYLSDVECGTPNPGLVNIEQLDAARTMSMPDDIPLSLTARAWTRAGGRRRGFAASLMADRVVRVAPAWTRARRRQEADS